MSEFVRPRTGPVVFKGEAASFLEPGPSEALRSLPRTGAFQDLSPRA